MHDIEKNAVVYGMYTVCTLTMNIRFAKHFSNQNSGRWRFIGRAFDA